MNPQEIHAKPTRFLRILGQQKILPAWTERDRESVNQKRLLDSQNSTGKKQADKTQLQSATFMKKGRMTKVQPQAQRGTLRVQLKPRAKVAEIRAMEDYSQALKPNPDSGVCPAAFQSYLGLMTPFYFLFPPFLKLNVCNCYPIPVPPWVLGRQRQITGLFSSTGPQLERTCVQLYLLDYMPELIYT